MRTWFSQSLGDGVLAYAPKDEIRAQFAPLFEAAGRPPGMAVFARHEMEGRLQCEVVAYFSPDAAALAQAWAAKPCARPTRHDLDLLAGAPESWDALFGDPPSGED